MSKILLATFLLCAALLPAHAADTLRPEQLKSGMKGYGLSVFKGTRPERFDVEVLGVLKNVFPKQDMILIRMSGADLEKHKVIAGMSGSPIFIDGKLIGALAYGWSFENDPLAGVTPIHNMLAELKNPGATRPSLLLNGARSRTATPPLLGNPPRLSENSRADFAAPGPLLTPLSLGGFDQRVVAQLLPNFQQFGMFPVAAGGGGAAEFKLPRGRMEPGGAIGVELIRGDLNAVAVGTATYVDGNKILAFGHPFFQGGTVEAPAVQAEVQTIMSSVATSFKLATSVASIGSMIGDWQSCIVADTKVEAKMIPVNVVVTSRDTGHNETYRMEVINNEAFTPILVQAAIANAVRVTSGSSQDTTVRIALAAELPDRTIRLSETFFNPSGGLLSFAALGPVVQVFDSPFGHPDVKRVEVTVEAALTRQTAEIKRAYFSKSEVRRGETVPLSVVLKPYGQPEVTKIIPIDVPPADDTMPVLMISVVAGSDAPPDVAEPDSLNDFLDTIQKQHHSTDLVALMRTPSQGMQYRGKLLKKLPASALAVLDDSSAGNIATAADIQQLGVPTDWVLIGQALVRVPIRQD